MTEDKRKNRKTKWITTSIVILAAIGAGAYYHSSRQNKTADASSDAPIPNTKREALNVNGKIVKTGVLTDEINATGSLRPDEEVDLTFETSGKITEINFEEGAFVTKGQLLAKVNDKPLQAQLAKFEVQQKLAEDRVYRQNALLAKDAVSQEAFEQASTELATLKAEMDLVKANIALTELRAPFDGIIGLRNVSEGAYASPSIVVAKLTKVSPIKLDFYIPERYAKDIKKGTRLTFNVDQNLESYNATVYAVESKIEDATRSLTVRAIYPNPGSKLVPGQSAYVKLKKQEIRNAIVIPTQAVIQEMGIPKVYLYKSGKAQPVAIETGIRTDADIQVLKGLSVGDTIITSGTLQLRTDLPVTLDNID